MILFLIILFWATGVILFSVYKIAFRGKDEYLVLFVILYLPFYTTILSLVYLQTQSELVVNFYQYAKELLVLLALLAFVFYKRDFFAYGFRLVFIDYLFLTFLGLAFVYAVLPLGEAGLVEKGIYFKNILLLGIMYFFGRNVTLKEFTITRVAHAVLGIAVAAFMLNLVEYVTDTHFQTHTGFSFYQVSLREGEVSGSYGLAWTFEASSGQKRLASFFTDPLELSSSVLMSFAMGFILFLTFPQSRYRLFYLAGAAGSVGSLALSVSRASMAGLFLQMFFVAIIFRLYSLILAGVGLFLLGVLYYYFFAAADVQEFVYATLTFQDSSSMGHLIEWLQGLQSMIDSPLGIGLAMSGNAGGVDDSLKVGGENQYIIFGVQMGVQGLLIYVALLAAAIIYSTKAYYKASEPAEKIIPFVAAATKIGLLLPLFTSNVETYMYVALTSWWMVGYSVNFYNTKVRAADR